MEVWIIFNNINILRMSMVCSIHGDLLKSIKILVIPIYHKNVIKFVCNYKNNSNIPNNIKKEKQVWRQYIFNFKL